MSKVTKTVINMKDGHVVQLIMPDFRDIDKYDLDTLLVIDETNIELEFITFPLLLARLGLVLAEAKYQTRKAELDMKTRKYKLKSEYRETIAKATNDKVDEETYSDPEYLEAYGNYIKAQKVEDMIDAAYWAAKDKSEKLDKLLGKIHPDEIVLNRAVDEFNTVRFKVKKSGVDGDYEKPSKSNKRK